jgi:anti-sigma regulatory factor (Ser/Thr protein kinase)
LHPDYQNAAGISPERGGPQCIVVKVRHESDIGAARRAAARLTALVGASESDAGAFALIVTEAATNIARYGRDGAIIVRDGRQSGAPYVEMIAIDKGPGISDMKRALADGFSSGGTAGKGLGAIRRMSQTFDIWTAPECGTAVLARVAIRGAKDDPPGSVGVICAAMGGDPASGDAWLVENTSGGTLIAVVDGLGHGADAAHAADAATTTILRRKNSSLAELFQHTHAALRSTRGAAVQIAIIDSESGTMRAAGVGNIAMSVSTRDASKSVASHPGIVGHQMSRLHEVTIPWTPESLLLAHTDGVSTKWKLDSYPALRMHDPALVAAVLYRDHGRERDDVTMLAFRSANTNNVVS